jgi:fluoroquinolone transport system permease protein
MRLAASIRSDIRLQVRHGFYTAYAVVCTAYVILLQVVPGEARAITNMMLTFSDPSALGFYFIGGMVLLERGQGVYDSLFVTPYKAVEYIASKTLSLSLLAVLSACVIHAATFGLTAKLLGIGASTGLTAVFFTTLGLGVAVRSRSVNGFFLQSAFYSLPFLLPIIPYFGMLESPLWRLLPTWGSLTLLEAAFLPAASSDIALACLVLILWIGLAFLWTYRQFDRHIMHRVGEGAKL